MLLWANEQLLGLKGKQLTCILSPINCHPPTVPQKEQTRQEVQEGEEVQVEEAQGRKVQEGP